MIRNRLNLGARLALTGAGLILYAAVATAAAAPAVQFLTLGGGYSFAAYANHDLSGHLDAIERVVVVQHGLQRDADHYFDTGEALLTDSGVDASHVLLIAPAFHESGDAVTLPPGAPPLPLWERGSWLQGQLSATAPHISGFEVYDDLLDWLVREGRLPHLSMIVLAGHSAGGQLITRYAVLSERDAAVRATGVELAYVIANPSSYLYFTAARPATPAGTPFSSETCPDFNQYRYGLEGMIPYGAGLGPEALYARFVTRRVTFLFGSADTDPNHRVLDRSCGAEAQGPTRYTRGHGYWMHLHQAFSGHTPRMSAFDVIGVGHDQAGMFGSRCAVPLLFGPVTGSAADRGAQCQAVP